MKKHAPFGTHVIEQIENNAADNDFLGTRHKNWDGSSIPPD
jgi:hypothetical protein